VLVAQVSRWREGVPRSSTDHESRLAGGFPRSTHRGDVDAKRSRQRGRLGIR